LTTDSSGNVYVADSDNNVVRKINVSTGIVSTYATGFSSPSGIAFDTNGNLYVSDTNTHLVRIVDTSGNVTTLAGDRRGYENGEALLSRFNSPASIAIDLNGIVYVTDYSNNTIRRINGPWLPIANFKGAIGIKGDIGAKGATGATGQRGPSGFSTNTGTTGATGPTGQRGLVGYGVGVTLNGLWESGATYT
jgi:sugar lactone lactonase YvrE